MDGSLAAQYGEEILSMRESIKTAPKLERERKYTEEKKPKEPKKPSPNHPWRKFKIHTEVCGKFLFSILEQLRANLL
jgi:hypothetical protein